MIITETFEDLQAENVALQQRVVELEQSIGEFQEQLTTIHTSEARYRGLVESQRDCIIRADTEGRFTFVNDAYCRVLGTTPEALLGQPFANYIYPDDLPAVLESVQALEVPPYRAYVENRIITPQGIRWFAWEDTAIKAADGTTLEVQAVGRDITDYKQALDEVQHLNADLELRAAERTAEAHRQTDLLNLILDQMSDGVVVADTEGRFLVFNQAAIAMFGDGATDIQQEAWSAHYGAFLPDQTTTFPSADLPLSRALRGEVTDNIEVFVRHALAPNGRWVTVSGRPLQDATGMLTGGVIVCRDITERKGMEQSLQRSEERVRILTETMPVACFIVQEGHYTYANTAAERLTGYTRMELATLDLMTIVHPDYRELVSDRAARRLRGEDVPPRYEIKLTSRTGEERWVDLYSYAMKFEEKPSLFLITQDITERKQEQAQQQMLVALIENSADLIGAATFDEHIAYINGAVRRTLGLEPEVDITHTQMADFFAPDDYRFIQEHILPVVLEQGHWGGEFRVRHFQTGRLVPAYYTLFTIKDLDTGQPIALGTVTRDLTEQKRAEAEREALQQQVIDAQHAALRELSSPLIPITNTTVVMPLIGTIDSQRAQQVLETLLEGVAQHQASLVILDITGVQVVDTQVADALIRAAQAVKLLGAQVMLTGIQPQIAQTLVHLGIELRGIVTQSTLQAGIAEALRSTSTLLKTQRSLA